MKLLIAYGSKGKYFHLKEFSESLSKLGVTCKIVRDSDYSTGFPSKNISEWFGTNKKFKKLVNDFRPDAVFIDRQSHFGVDVIKEKIPLFVLLRGHYWSEQEWAKKTIHTGLIVRVVLWFRNKLAEKCFKNATAIFPICKYLEDVVKEHYPDKKTHVFFEGISFSRWYKVKGMKLNHPCVGLLQDANWWGKSKEMLTLQKVLESMPNITFYWAGDGPYREKILNTLDKYENFVWLDRLEYPDKVREFLSEIDVYALISGMDLAPLTLKEAQLMQKAVIATNAGGIPEMMVTGKTGYLVEEGNHKDIIEKLTVLLNDNKKTEKMGVEGRKFVIESFSWDLIAKKFLGVLKLYIKE